LGSQRKGHLMSLRLSYLDILSSIVPPVRWVSRCYSAPPRRAMPATIRQTRCLQLRGVPERLAALREVVSELGSATIKPG
jgi:hypothetical protein